MAQSPSLGASAQIFTLPTAANTPVQQSRTRGRHPKSIALLWKARNAHRAAKNEARDTAYRIAELRRFIEKSEDYLSSARYDLAILTQTASSRKGAANV